MPVGDPGLVFVICFIVVKYRGIMAITLVNLWVRLWAAIQYATVLQCNCNFGPLPTFDGSWALLYGAKDSKTFACRWRFMHMHNWMHLFKFKRRKDLANHTFLVTFQNCLNVTLCTPVVVSETRTHSGGCRNIPVWTFYLKTNLEMWLCDKDSFSADAMQNTLQA